MLLVLNDKAIYMKQVASLVSLILFATLVQAGSYAPQTNSDQGGGISEIDSSALQLPDSLHRNQTDTLRVKVLYAETIHADTVISDTSRADTPKLAEHICGCKDSLILNNRAWWKHKFDFNGYVFTDLAGIDDDQPNGLLQTQVYFSYTRPRKVYRTEMENYARVCKNFYLFRNVVLLDITVSKIGNQNSELPVRYVFAEDTTRLLNRYDLYQYSHVIAASKLNLMTYKWPKVLSLYLDFSPILYNTYLSDSLSSKDKISVSTMAFGLNLKALTYMHERTRLSAECSYSFYEPVLYSDFYSDVASYQIKEPYDGNTVRQDKYPKTIQVLDIRIRHIPENEKLSSFLRFSLFGNIIKPRDVPGNIFFQFQLGASFNFSSFDMFKQNDDDEPDKE
jgi:hypothetical protein